MKKHSMPEMKEGGVNVTPLIDIIMCLIVFFMLVTKVGVSRGVDKDIKLPNTVFGAKISDLGSTLTLNVHNIASGRPPQVTSLVNGQNQDLAIYIEATKDHPLRRVLEEFKKTHPVKAQVILRGDAELDYSAMELVLVELNQAGITDTAYETSPKPAAAAPVE